MSFKQLFSRSLGADPGRLHFAAHSHHLWPDSSFDGHVAAWNDAARLADRKWDKVMEEIWPAAQAEVANELGAADPGCVVFAPNTHELLVRIFSALGRNGPIRVLTTDGEFHSARRQLARWVEAGTAVVDRVAVEPFADFSARFLQAARTGLHDLVLVSHVMFGSGLVFDGVEELASLAQTGGPWVVVDGYHAFMAIPHPFGTAGPERLGSVPSAVEAGATRVPTVQSADRAFYLGGGYKYAMSGEGCAFMHAPTGFGSRPSNTGWFAEFDDLDLPAGSVGYAKDGRRYLGATFDPSGLYRFVAVRRMLRENGLTTKSISDHVRSLQDQLIAELGSTPLAAGRLLNPISSGPHARFLAFQTPAATTWYNALKARNCITDVRGDVLRIGFGIYQDTADVERLIGLLGELRDAQP